MKTAAISDGRFWEVGDPVLLREQLVRCRELNLLPHGDVTNLNGVSGLMCSLKKGGCYVY